MERTGIRGVSGKHPVTPEAFLDFGKSFVTLISENKGHGEKIRIVVGRDTRNSGKVLEKSLIAGITSAGADVSLIGIMPSNAVSHLVLVNGFDGGLMISASHNPSEQNGLKFFNAEGFKLSESEETRLEAIFSSKSFVSSGEGAVSEISGAKENYIAMILNSLKDPSLSGLRLALDPGNGAGFSVIKEVFRKLDCSTAIINNQPDGNNVNCGGALFPETLQNLVKEGGFDAGICLDGDADRLVMTDEKGNLLDGDSLIAIAAINLQKKGKLNGNTVVVTDYSNSGLDNSLKKHGIKVVRVKTGDRFVSQALSENDYSLGGELSGHIIFSEFSRTADAILASIHVLNALKEEEKKLSELASVIKKYPGFTLNVAVKEKKSLESMPLLMERIKKTQEILGKEGRVFVRYSGTENVLRILVEGQHEKELKRMAEEISETFKSQLGAAK